MGFILYIMSLKTNKLSQNKRSFRNTQDNIGLRVRVIKKGWLKVQSFNTEHLSQE
jgi:DNA primase large subunit